MRTTPAIWPVYWQAACHRPVPSPPCWVPTLVPPVVAFNEGYVAGAMSVNADINVISTYHPGEISQAFVDPEWGAATAKQALDQGADVIFGAGGITGNGALQEIATADGARRKPSSASA